MHRGRTVWLLVALLTRPLFANVAAEFEYTTISAPGAVSTGASGINNKGQIVGYDDTGSGDPRVVDHAFLLSGGVFTPLNDPAGDSTMPTSINDAGQIAGSYNVSLDEHAFLFDQGVYATIDPPGRGQFASANGINNAGRVVGYFSDPPAQKYHAFSYANGQFTQFDFPGSGFTIGFGVNDAGDVVGDFHFDTGDEHGFLLANGSFSQINYPGATFTIATAINNHNDIVGQYGDAAGGLHGFLLSGGVFTPLDVPGALKTSATGINDAGQIVGWDAFRTGGTGFLATPVPEPSVVLPLSFAGALLFMRGARKKGREA